MLEKFGSGFGIFIVRYYIQAETVQDVNRCVCTKRCFVRRSHFEPVERCGLQYDRQSIHILLLNGSLKLCYSNLIYGEHLSGLPIVAGNPWTLMSQECENCYSRETSSLLEGQLGCLLLDSVTGFVSKHKFGIWSFQKVLVPKKPKCFRNTVWAKQGIEIRTSFGCRISWTI